MNFELIFLKIQIVNFLKYRARYRIIRENTVGVTFTSDLNWKDHILGITARAKRLLGSLKKAFVSRGSTLWKNLYISLVRPHLEYAVKVWSPTK